MPKILIIGNSIAAATAVEQIRKEDTASEITLVCSEGVLPYNHSLLSSLVAKDIREPHLLVHSEKFFQAHNVKLVLNDPVVRISVKRKHIATQGKVQIAFDKLLLIDPPAVRLPSIKGHQKEGVFDALRAVSVKALIKYLPFADNVIVVVTDFSGFDMACALSRLGKSVVVVTSTAGVLGDILDEESSVLLKQVIESKGIRVMDETAVEEILGDAQVKAVRLKAGKVIAAEAVIFDSLSSDLRILAESGFVEEGQVKAGEFFETSAEGVFACDAILNGYGLSSEESAEQGRCAAVNMLNTGSSVYHPPFSLRVFGLKVCDGFCGGVIRLVEGGRELMKFDGPQNIYKKIYLQDGHLLGAVWFNALGDKDKVGQAIAQRVSLAGVEDQFLQATALQGQ